jgi:hypothetical protein
MKFLCIGILQQSIGTLQIPSRDLQRVFQICKAMRKIPNCYCMTTEYTACNFFCLFQKRKRSCSEMRELLYLVQISHHEVRLPSFLMLTAILLFYSHLYLHFTAHNSSITCLNAFDSFLTFVLKRMSRLQN